MRRTAHLIVAGALIAALAGCANSSTGSPGGGSASPVPSGTTLSVGDTKLGDIVVDGHGMTVYFYKPDKPGSGKSSCTGACASQWPAVHSDSNQPKVQGVTGAVGTITGTDGKLQVTVDKRPVYTFVGDGSAGDVSGQGYDDIWWAVGPDGSEVTTMSSSSGGGGY
ncbi:COG4315 family predicted lipoprotein [Xylanimonas sp. McL0601]|uniref:COG4315 family predicted lipoprotein n=1 Tax=Xylanimonas sp. McL0601 TaxID=3414739 RepID=UPI003CE765BC